MKISTLFSSVAQSFPILCDPVDCSTPGFPVHHQLPELTQAHVHRLGDVIQPPHSLLFPSPAFSLSQHQGLFQRVSSSIIRRLPLKHSQSPLQRLKTNKHTNKTQQTGGGTGDGCILRQSRTLP